MVCDWCALARNYQRDLDVCSCGAFCSLISNKPILHKTITIWHAVDAFRIVCIVTFCIIFNQLMSHFGQPERDAHTIPPTMRSVASWLNW